MYITFMYYYLEEKNPAAIIMEWFSITNLPQTVKLIHGFLLNKCHLARVVKAQINDLDNQLM